MSDSSQQPDQEGEAPVLRPHPLVRNPLFTGYDDLLANIPQFFLHHPLLILSGPPGIGKTQIALEYGCRFADAYETIFWLNASLRSMLSRDIETLLDWSSGSQKTWMRENEIFAFFKDWLHTHTKWLLILDNIDEFTYIDSFLPKEPSGHILLTSRHTAFELSPPQLPHVLQRAKFIIIGASAITPSSPNSLHDQKLSELPITTHFVNTLGTSLTKALALFEQRQTAFQARNAEQRDAFRREDVALLLNEFSHMLPPILLELLRLSVFLHPDALPVELLSEAAEVVSEPLAALLAEPLVLEQTLSDLEDEELLSYQQEDQSLNLHPGLRTVLIESLPQNELHVWVSLVVRVLEHAFPVVRFDTREQCERLRPLAERGVTLITQFQIILPEGALLLERLGSFASRQARYVEAETYLTQALDLYEHHLQAYALDAAQTMNSLGLLYGELARYQDAEAVHLRALEIREQEGGSDDPTTAESLHNLAMLYGDLGQYHRAEELFLRVLSIEERSKGVDHLDVASTLNNLGLIYSHQGRDDEAETVYRRALTIYEHFLPSDHPDLAYPLDGLGALAEKRGKYQQAEEFYEQALAICRSAFGELHPETAHSLNKLAGTAESQGNDQHAQELYEQALAIGETMLGSEHPDVALFLTNLAFLMTKLGQYAQAEGRYQRALHIYEQTLGTEHPDVASVLSNLGELYRKMENVERAEAFLRRALGINELSLGPTHPDTVRILERLADLLAKQHRDEEAE